VRLLQKQGPGVYFAIDASALFRDFLF
jgi:hypothetical protein